MNVKLLLVALFFSSIFYGQFTEDFESYGVGPMGTQNLSRWTSNDSNADYTSVQVSDEFSVSGTKCGKFHVTATDTTQATLNLGNLNSGKWRIKFKMRRETLAMNWLNIASSSNSNPFGSFVFDLNTFRVNYPNAPVVNTPMNQWFDFAIELNFNNGSYRIFIDNVAYTPIAKVFNSADIDKIVFVGPFELTQYFIDDIVLEEFTSPETYLLADVNFEQALIDLGYDTNGLTGDILITDAQVVTDLNVSNKSISDLTGIEGFVNLTYLDAGYNNLSSIDVSALSVLETLVVHYNQITSLDLSSNSNLLNLYADYNQLNTLSFSNSNLIENINIVASSITNINVTNYNNLKYLDVSSTGITSVDLTQNTNLLGYYHNYVNLTGLNLTNNLNLKYLSVYDCGLTSLNLSNNVFLEQLWMGGNSIPTNFNFSIFPNLTLLNIYSPNAGFKFSTIDLSNNLNLNYLYLFDNLLTDLDLSQHTNLFQVELNSNQLTSFRIDNGNNVNLQRLFIYNNPNLSCAQVDDVTYADTQVTNGVWFKDATTTFSTDCAALLTNEDFTSTEFKIYPNPVQSILHIDNALDLNKVEIYSITGKKVKFITNNLSEIDVNELESGIYFVKLFTNKGITTQKIIKE